MAKKEKEKKDTVAEEVVEEIMEETPEVNPFEEKYNAEHDAHLRLAAEYDNFRKRTAKEKEQSYQNGRSDAVEKLLPVYDNLERALKAECSDEAFKKGVEMTMTQLKEIFAKLGVEEIECENCPFDAAYHNAVMHIDDEAFGENTVAECFQKGFKIGDKVIRFAMVKVAN